MISDGKLSTVSRRGVLRSLLLADGAFEVALGVGALAGARRAATYLGAASPLGVGATGAGLVAYGAWLLREAVRGPVSRRSGLPAAGLNAAGAAGGAALLLGDRPHLSDAGRRTLAAVLGVVALLAALQLGAARSLRARHTERGDRR